ncbi:hypothetical protein ACFELO_10055 [Oceanicaulis sp. LC35]|uniref:hypothetical protein n=1 Tax=Oceanicaulis sp. LC35 TaxID=3349635 RepID=UPI003F83F61B
MSGFKLASALAFASMVSCGAHAQTVVPAGPEVLVNTTTANNQYSSAAAYLAGGGYVIVWSDDSLTGGDTDGSAVLGQRYDANGIAQGGEFLVNTTTADRQRFPSIAALTGGGFVVTWTDESQTGGDTNGNAVRAQVFDADGARVGGELQVNSSTISNQDASDVAALADGGFVVVFEDLSRTGADISQTAIRGRRYNASGSPLSAEFLVNTTTSEFQNNGRVAGLSNGGFVVVWGDDSSSGGDTSDDAVRGQIYTSSAVRSGGEFLINLVTVNDQAIPDVAALGDGFIVVWQDRSLLLGDNSGSAIAAGAFDVSGNRLWGDRLINTTTTSDQQAPRVAVMSNGNPVVTWEDLSLSADDTSLHAVRAQVIDEDGDKIGSEFLVNTITANSQNRVTIDADDQEGFIISWTDGSGLGGDAVPVAVRSQRYVTVRDNDRVIDAFVTAASDFGATGTQVLASEVDYDAASITGDLQLAIVVQNDDQFAAYPSPADLEITLEGAVFDGHVQQSAFSSGGPCAFSLYRDGRSDGNVVTFRTSALSQCDDQMTDRTYTAGVDDDDMVFTLPIRLTGGEVNASVEIRLVATGLVLASDVQDNNDANTTADPVAQAVDGFVVRTFGTAARTAENPLGETVVNATLASDYNDLDARRLGTLEAVVQGQVFVGGAAVNASLAAHTDELELVVTLSDATGLEALELSSGGASLRAPLVDNVARFVVTGASDVTLTHIAGGAVDILAVPDADADTQITVGTVSTTTSLDFGTLALTDETLSGGANAIGREGLVSSTFEWVGSGDAGVRNVFRLTGLGDALPAMWVTLTHSSEGENGTYALSPAGELRNGELIVTQADLEDAVGGSFGRADAQFSVEASGVRIRRFLISADGALTDMGDDNN